MKEIINQLKNYKMLKAEIRNLELDIEELREEIGPAPIGYEERTGETNKFSSATENVALDLMDKVARIEILKRAKEREIERIENALSVLNEKEKFIIETIYIKGCKWDTVTYKLDREYSSCKKIEQEAFKKIGRFLN